ncbi:hypothetical protein HDG34_005838 [Paraburkholderia sp. HC6.4b]|uniref:hypothetical protein n=1 Tax=unclassified Paraburkholderia TaxID=2615204 RepID=UPI001613A6A4|nr:MULTISPECIES: hypothetical protein [unclassified Paraburkholderia]MBB5411872.1 hypothetical protein [Paraburkholderia sp. HC6.4b]MBB5450184.1 hypothetical protein [Paraburkholderia sp. Kb1A]
MHPTFNLPRTDDAVQFLTERAQAAHDDAHEHAESRQDRLARITAECLKLRRERLDGADLVAGMPPDTESNRALLHAAALAGDEAFGAVCFSFIADYMAGEAAIEAEEIVARLEGDAREDDRGPRVYRICGEDL